MTEWIEKELEQADPTINNSLSKRMYWQISREIKQKKGTKQILNYVKLLRWAAIILLPVASALITYYCMSTGKDFGKDATVTFTTGYGEKAEVILADGSHVWLNAGSSLTYGEKQFNRKERKVFLRGEACFEVESNRKKTFVVETKDMTLIATGTTFNVTAYDNDPSARSVLLEGELLVRTPIRKELLSENQRATYWKESRTLTTDEVYARDYVEWRGGSFYFDNCSFTEITRTLSRVFNVEIHLLSDELREMRFTGTLGNSSIKNVLDILTLASPMRYTMKGTTFELYMTE